MLDDVRLRGELAHIHRALSTVASTDRGKHLADELRRATGTTTAAVLWHALFADCLRVVYSAVSADDTICDEEIDAVYDLVFSIARHYANVQQARYGAFEAIEHGEVRPFLECYAADTGPFGRKAERHWQGLFLCRKSAELGETEPLERYERLMSWLIAEACRIGSVTESDPRWRGRVDELHELRRALAHHAKVASPKVDLRVQAFLTPTRAFAAVQQASSVYDDDPFDVETIHAETRQAFAEMVERATSPDIYGDRGRMMLILGDAGTGKTHLLRGLRKHVQEYRHGFVVYAQLHSSSEDYARYLLQHVVDSLARPYAGPSGDQTGMNELISGLPELVGGELRPRVERLIHDKWETAESLADYIADLADDMLLHRELTSFDPAFLRVLLFALHPDPRITSRVYKYLRCEDMSAADRRWIGGTPPRIDKDDPRRMIHELGRLAFVARGGALVLMVDQADLAGFNAASVASFRRAIDTLQGIVSELPSAIAIVACLTDLYEAVRPELLRSTIDRLEKDPGVERLQINRSYEEILAIVGRRLSWMYAELGAVYQPETPVYPIPESRLRALTNHRTRAILEWCHQFQTQCMAEGRIIEQDDVVPTVVDLLTPEADFDGIGAAWNDAVHASGIELPDDDDEVLAILEATAKACAEESGLTLVTSALRSGALRVQFQGPAAQSSLTLAVTNRSYHRGAFTGQLETLRRAARSSVPVAVRTVPYPRGAASDAAVAKLVTGGGRAELLDTSTLRTLIAFQQFKPDFPAERVAEWRRREQPISTMPGVVRLFDLDRLNAPASIEAAPVAPEEASAAPVAVKPEKSDLTKPDKSGKPERVESKDKDKDREKDKGEKKAANGKKPIGKPPRQPTNPPEAALAGDGAPDVANHGSIEAALAQAVELPAAAEVVALSTIHVGTTAGFSAEPRSIERSSLLRHTGVLGSSGSGKTTLALNLIEQVLEHDVPVVMVDRKGDLSGYAKPDWWQHTADPERARKLAERLDVRLFTPGSRIGRPLSISVVPNLERVPEHERDRMIGYSSQALAAMMRLGTSSNDAAKRVILAQAISVLSSGKKRGGLAELIDLLESRDDALIARAGRYDDKLFRQLLQSLETVRLSEMELFDPTAEPLTFDTLLGRKPGGKVPLAIISTKFLGEIERIQSWVAHLLACLSRQLTQSPSAQLQAVLMLDEADLFMPAGAAKPPSKEPLQDLLKRGRSAGLGVMLASQSPGDFDYRSREQINTWFLGKISDQRSIDKMKPLFEQRPAVGSKVGSLEVGRFVMLQDGGATDLERAPSLLRTEQINETDLLPLAASGRPHANAPAAEQRRPRRIG
jgi:Helicase HerA, central domain/AAA ATPase domain